jgi:heme-degrading monooxygenase HmoA
MIVTIFRNRLKSENVEEYYATAGRMSEIAQSMPGHISHKTFAAEDGERVTIVEFADEASQRAWSTEVRHQEAKKRGRAAFYAEYKLQVCEVKREHAFTAPAQAAQEA